MRVKTYEVLAEQVEAGVRYGLGRCQKYEIDPHSDAGIEKIHNEVMGAICDRFTWDDELPGDD